MSGDRFNKGKRRWGLLSYKALEELVKVLEFGATKYAPYNWAKGLSFTETWESMQRHMLAWYNGEDVDQETRCNHMAHVMCNAMFLMHFILTGTGSDDRHNKEVVKNGEAKPITEEELYRQLVEQARSRPNAMVDGRVPNLQAYVRQEAE